MTKKQVASRPQDLLTLITIESNSTQLVKFQAYVAESLHKS